MIHRIRIQTNNDLRRAVQHFNGGEWRDALLVFEQFWLVERRDELKAYVQLSNAVMQLHDGYVSSPRRLMQRVFQILTTEPATLGIDVAQLLRAVLQVQAIIPHEGESGEVSLLGPVPSIMIVWHA
ncbi:MAG: hypothetical protein FJ040_02280 [Chloroflexi bacterium]|nr:hypothetical protein [Chloroflexota bacterium]